MTQSASLPTASTIDRRPLFSILIPRIHRLDASIAPILLFCSNADLADACESVLYSELLIDIDVPGYASTEDDGERDVARRKVDCLLRYPRLGQHVLSLAFRHASPSTRQSLPCPDEDTRETERSQAWNLASELFRICPNLNSFTWELCFGLGGDIWQGIASARHLTSLTVDYPSTEQYPNVQTVSYPRITPQLEYLAPSPSTTNTPGRLSGKGGWGLGPGWEYLKALKLAGLSQNGAKTLATHLQLLSSSSSPTLVSLDLSTHFLEPTLLSSIADYGQLGSLKHLTLATSGTRFKEDGLQQVLEGCQALESFVLKAGEGRLANHAWADISSWPPSLRRLEIEFDETAGIHSWALYHLDSIHQVPFAQLDTFAVRRLVHPIARLPFPTAGVAVPAVRDGYELTPIPVKLLDAIKEGDSGVKMKSLCLDWWELGPNELDGLVKACPGLKRLEVAISFPLVKLVTMMQTTFAGSADLEEMVFTNAPKYNLEFAPTKSKPDYTTPDMPAYLVTKLQEPDPSIPETKDLRKFVRRLPKLRTIKWTGRGGKGEWSFSKKTTLVNVSFKPAAVLSQRDWGLSQIDPPYLNYAELATNRPTLLEPPLTPTVTSSPIADFPSLSRTSTASIGSHRVPITPGSPTHPKSFTPRDIDSRLQGLGITPESPDNGHADYFPSPSIPRHQHQHRRETTDGSIASSKATKLNTSTAATVNRGRRVSADLSKTTKRLTIGAESTRSPPLTGSLKSPPAITSPSAGAGAGAGAGPTSMLKTTSAPARTTGGSSETAKTSKSNSGLGLGSAKANKNSDKSSRERKIEGPRRSK